MMAGRSDWKEGNLSDSLPQEVDSRGTGTGRSQRRLPRIDADHRVGIEPPSAGRTETLDRLNIFGQMHPCQEIEIYSRR